MIWMKNSRGKYDAMLSFAFAGLIVTCFCTVMSIFESISVGGVTFLFRAPDATLVLGLLSATAGSYVFKRTSDSKYEVEKIKVEKKTEKKNEQEK